MMVDSAARETLLISLRTLLDTFGIMLVHGSTKYIKLESFLDIGMWKCYTDI